MPNLLSLPLTLTRIALKPARFAAETALDVVGGLIGRDERPADRAAASQSREETPPRPAAASTQAPSAPASAPPPEPAPTATPAPSAEALAEFDRTDPVAPPHIEAEGELVASFGPSDDVTGEIHVSEPWPHYDDMHAPDVVDRLRAADEATRAVVALYERQGRKRSSVLEAATG